VLLPRLRDAEPSTVVLADGFSCRTQIHELDSGGHEAMHLAELLDGGAPAPRPAPTRAARSVALAVAGSAATGVAVGLAAAARGLLRRTTHP
jgi:hypothetical protein